MRVDAVPEGKPCFLHPTPYTLHPTPYTLHPTPYTLHPSLYTLKAFAQATLHQTSLHADKANPTPYTLGG